MGLVAGHEGVGVFRPRKERRVVRNMQMDLDPFAVFEAGFTFRIVDLHHGQGCFFQNGFIEIVERFDAGKNIGRVFAEKHHETGVPDPDVGDAARFIHIGRLRHPGNFQNMCVCQFPRAVVKFQIFRAFIEHGNGNRFFPVGIVDIVIFRFHIFSFRF